MSISSDSASSTAAVHAPAQEPARHAHTEAALHEASRSQKPHEFQQSQSVLSEQVAKLVRPLAGSNVDDNDGTGMQMCKTMTPLRDKEVLLLHV